MEKDDRAAQLKGRVTEIDAKFPTPEARAQKILAFLKEKYGDDLDTWDVTCFAAEWLGMMCPAFPFLEDNARSLLRLVYFTHYQRFERELKNEGTGRN